MIDQISIDVVVAALLPSIDSHQKKIERAFCLGLSGVQGSGKSTWAAALAHRLTDKHNLHTRTISLDDLYLDHDDLLSLKQNNFGNKLLQARGQPGTHDEKLAQSFLTEVLAPSLGSDRRARIKWPAYDKSLNNGQGGRVPVSEWELVSLDERLDVLIFEGWCLGFQPLPQDELREKRRMSESSPPSQTQKVTERLTETLQFHDLEHLLLINASLKRYCETFMGPETFDSFVHLTTDDLSRVYCWREDQEEALRRKGKPAMAKEDVIKFVQGYMPAYELYLERLNERSLFQSSPLAVGKKHIRVVLDNNRNVVSTNVL
ncbi:hypothetical protein PCL_04393 [Purpureocillium lilacinum]|uniref:D-glycerate 3-kinase n=1 Tax=Purpureocillium lilacinum TaxID=33203 RepID=A0A2U3DY93_PURLI|nr:hypothetical protein PCL_04393 [Purpureocillium lilacinum]